VSTAGPEVSVVIPVRDGGRWLREVLDAVLAAAGGRPFEVVLVDDGSRDDSMALASAYLGDGRVRVVRGPGRGAAAALNVGFAAAAYELVAQVDQDVVITPGWLDLLSAELRDRTVGAAQGHYEAAADASVWARVAGLDLALRYAAIRGPQTDHVCTGNSVFRRAAVLEVGGFDESLGYGYDNDMSYRLAAAGHRLVFNREARATHHWPAGPGGYVRQQYGQGYGRLEVVARHPHKVLGDRVSGAGMILHVPANLAALLAAAASCAAAVAGGPWRLLASVALALVATLSVERTVAGVRAVRRLGDPAGLLFPLVHLIRDVAWVGALLAWALRRLLRMPSRPSHSMR
jgi:hypothetical protein